MERTATPSTGVPAIDAQVGELFGRARALLEALRAGAADEVVLRHLTSLEQQAIVHFAAEERLMVARAYPGLAPHLREHEKFRVELRELKELFFRRGPVPEVTARLQRLTGGWLVGHVHRDDASLATFLRAPAA